MPQNRNRKPVETKDGLLVFCGFTKLADPKKLKPHPENTRTHPNGQKELLAEIIKAHGWRETITVSKRSGLITRGHARLETALEKGWTEVPIDEQHYGSAEQELADLVADTRIKEFSSLDDARLRKIIVKMQGDGANLRLTALNESLIDTILQEYEQNLRLQMITPENPDAGDLIRQVILVYDDKQFGRFGKAASKLAEKLQIGSVSELCLKLLRDHNGIKDAKPKAD